MRLPPSNEIFVYYSPEAQSIIVGEVYTKDGRNLTREKQQENITKKIGEKIKDIPLPESCHDRQRKTYHYWDHRSGLSILQESLRVFFQANRCDQICLFFPLPSHPRGKRTKHFTSYARKTRPRLRGRHVPVSFDNIDFKACEDTQPQNSWRLIRMWPISWKSGAHLSFLLMESLRFSAPTFPNWKNCHTERKTNNKIKWSFSHTWEPISFYTFPVLIILRPFPRWQGSYAGRVPGQNEKNR